MAAGRPNTINLGLLAVTILSMLLAAYSLMLAPADEVRANAQRNGNRDTPDHESAGDGSTADRCAAAESKKSAISKSGHETSSDANKDTVSTKSDVHAGSEPGKAASGGADATAADTSGIIAGVV